MLWHFNLSLTIKQIGLDDISSFNNQVHDIQSLLQHEYKDLSPNIFQFKHTAAAAMHNTSILSKHNFDLEAMFSQTTENTHLQMGSEFRPTVDLQPLLATYPLWTRIKNLFNKGVEIPLTPMDTEEEMEDNKAILQRGNHKGATSQPSLLNKLVTKDIEHAFALPISPASTLKIKGGRLAPLNIASQWTIDEKGEKIKKKRLTHDQSFQGLVSGQSLNEQVITEDLEPIIYGHMFLRICHMIHAMRFAHPTVHILMC